MSERLNLGASVLAGMAMLLGGCGREAPPPDAPPNLTPNLPTAAAFSNDGRWLLVGHAFSFDDKGRVRLWDLKTGKVAGHYAGHDARVFFVGFVDDRGERFLTADNDNHVILHERASGKQIWSIQTPLGVMTRLALSDDGRRFFSGSAVFETASGKLVRNCDKASDWDSFAISGDGRWALTGAGSNFEDATVKLWNLNSGKITYEWWGSRGWRDPFALSRDGTKVILNVLRRTQDPDPELRYRPNLVIWDTKGEKILAELEESDTILATMVPGQQLTITADDKYVLSLCEADTIKTWNTTTGKVERRAFIVDPPPKIDTGREIPVYRVMFAAFSRNGRWAFVNRQDCTDLRAGCNEFYRFEIWNLEKGRQHRLLEELLHTP